MGRKRLKAGTRRPGAAERAAGGQGAVLKARSRPTIPNTKPVIVVKSHGVLKFKCAGCTKVLKTQGAFSTHVKACAQYGCAKCGVLFKTSAALHGHRSRGKCRVFTAAVRLRQRPKATTSPLLSTRDSRYGLPREASRDLPSGYHMQDCYIAISRMATLEDTGHKGLSNDSIESEVNYFTLDYTEPTPSNT